MTPHEFTFAPDEFNAATYFVDRHIADGRGQKVVIECEEKRVTYQQLFEMVNRVGNCLRRLGVRIEERVFLLLFDTPEFAASFFGAIKIGAVPVPINTLLKPADYKYLLNDSRARVAIVSEALVPLIKAIPRQSLQFLETILVVGTKAWPGMAPMNSNFPAPWPVLCYARDTGQLQRWRTNCKRLSVAVWRISSGRIRSSSTPNFRRQPQESYSASDFGPAGKIGRSAESRGNRSLSSAGLGRFRRRRDRV